MTHISINKALSEIKAGEICSVIYIRSTGKQIGTLKHIDETICGWAYNGFNAIKKKEYDQMQGPGRHTIGGTIPMIDLSTNTQLTLLIANIIFYNNLKVIH
jgi:hypothetical protein